MLDDECLALARTVLGTCEPKGLMVATAESCTGGLVIAALTSIAGSASVVERGFVTYSNEAKAEMLGVPMELIEAHGAVSAPVARAMAEGALRRSKAGLAVAITGIAGPTGGSEGKPVGLVRFACACDGQEVRHLERRYGELSRAEIRRRSVLDALKLLLAGAEAA